ncbi:MAG TPA: hypothetical protein VLV76_17630 [Candidatus Acidoferrum sp.]|nr:hypothetical protein [Candidatus Acidoferrum sp.]
MLVVGASIAIGLVALRIPAVEWTARIAWVLLTAIVATLLAWQRDFSIRIAVFGYVGAMITVGTIIGVIVLVEAILALGDLARAGRP